MQALMSGLPLGLVDPCYERVRAFAMGGLSCGDRNNVLPIASAFSRSAVHSRDALWQHNSTTTLLGNALKKLQFVAMALMPATLLGAPAFDTEKYCQEVAQAIGGSYQIEEACRKQERNAQSVLQRRQIPTRIERYCREVGQAIGGSYQIMNACVDQELAAKARL